MTTATRTATTIEPPRWLTPLVAWQGVYTLAAALVTVLIATGTGIVVEPVINVEPASLAFGDVDVNGGLANQSVTISNTGNADLAFGTPPVTIVGMNPGDFSVVQPPAVIAAGGERVAVG